MALRDSYLFPTLEAGSSRVFNVCSCTALLKRSMAESAGAADPGLLFKVPELNNVILVKEARPSRKITLYEFAHPIGTKLYFPYDYDRIYDGGKSVFFDDPQIRHALKDHAGLDFDARREDANRDLQTINVLNELPSLDPFLVKDQLDIEGIHADEIYFQISETEWKVIQAHVSEKLKPMIAFAFGDSEDLDRGRSLFLLEKLWNTKDIEPLMPIVDAFGLPHQEASKIFSAWKGVMYYDFEYNRSLPRWKLNVQWMHQDAGPTDFINPEQRAMLLDLSDSVRQKFQGFWQELRGIFSAYEDAYDKLFVHRQEPGPFLEFMRNAVKAYWVLGSRMSAINHSVVIWDMLTSGTFKRRLRYEQLYHLFGLQHEIFESCEA